jgi:hypothetical protein
LERRLHEKSSQEAEHHPPPEIEEPDLSEKAVVDLDAVSVEKEGIAGDSAEKEEESREEHGEQEEVSEVGNAAARKTVNRVKGGRRKRGR